MNSRSLKIWAGMVFVLGLTFSVNAAVLTVTSLADSGPGSLRDEVAASAEGDTVQFAVGGTIVLNGAITIGHSLSIYGPGPSGLVVDANHQDRAFVVTGTSTNVICGVTITNGFAAGSAGSDGSVGQDGSDGGSAAGGAILDEGNSLVLSNCWLVQNTALGGAGGNGGTNLVGTNGFALPGNGGTGGAAAGGAIYTSAPGTLVNCTFSDNAATGGVGGTGGTTFNDSRPGGTGGNGGNGFGGAVECGNGLAMINCTFSGNRAVGGQGGAGGESIYYLNGNPNFYAGGTGGGGGNGEAGAVNAGISIVNFQHCTIVSNSAVAGAGGAGANGLPPGTNGPPGVGSEGGVSAYKITCNNPIANTILSDNFATTADQNYSAGFNDHGYNFIGSDDFTGCGWGPTTQVGTVALPLHAQLGPLAQNGGGLPTHAPLIKTPAGTPSPVIDAGSSFGLTTDERGAPRTYDFTAIANAPGGDGTDIGAFELGSPDLGAAVGSGNNLVVSWPAYYGDFILQSSMDLPGSNNWNDVLETPLLVGNRFVVTNRLTNPAMFYRLKGQ